MARPVAGRRTTAAALPQWIRPQLTQLVDKAPDGPGWLHEIKYDGYRMHARLDRGRVKLLTRTGLDWTHKYPAIAGAVAALDARQAYLDGELCGVGPDGITSFSIVQLASDSGNAAALVFFLFDLLHLDGEDLRPRPLIERKDLLAALLANAPSPLHYSDHQLGQSRAFHAKDVARGHRLFSAHCCSAITIRTEGWSMPAAWAAASTPPSLNGCGTGCSRSPRTRCRLIARRRAAPASAHPPC